MGLELEGNYLMIHIEKTFVMIQYIFMENHNINWQKQDVQEREWN